MFRISTLLKENIYYNFSTSIEQKITSAVAVGLLYRRWAPGFEPRRRRAVFNRTLLPTGCQSGAEFLRICVPRQPYGMIKNPSMDTLDIPWRCLNTTIYTKYQLQGCHSEKSCRFPKSRDNFGHSTYYRYTTDCSVSVREVCYRYTTGSFDGPTRFRRT